MMNEPTVHRFCSSIKMQVRKRWKWDRQEKPYREDQTEKSVVKSSSQRSFWLQALDWSLLRKWKRCSSTTLDEVLRLLAHPRNFPFCLRLYYIIWTIFFFFFFRFWYYIIRISSELRKSHKMFLCLCWFNKLTLYQKIIIYIICV